MRLEAAVLKVVPFAGWDLGGVSVSGLQDGAGIDGGSVLDRG